MSDTDKKKTILEQVFNEERDQRLKEKKAKLKELVKDRMKTQDILSGIDDKIIELTENETSESIKQLFDM